MKRLFITSFFNAFWAVILFMIPVRAQVVLTGKVLAENQKPAEFATVALYTYTDSTLVTGVISDSSGHFTLAKVNPAQYVLRVSLLGYQRFVSQVVTVKPDMARLDVGTFSLVPEASLLNEIVVKGERPMIERQVGKLIVNVNSGVFKTASTALDVLSRAPELLFDNNGNLTFRGMFAPRLMIDGKYATMSEVRSIPASDIDKVEIITNPSAKYEGDSRVIVNLILKRDKNLGLAGTVYGEYGLNRYSRYEGGTSLQYKTRKVVYFGRYEHYDIKTFQDITIDRLVRNQQFNQQTGVVNKPSGDTYRLGFDYQLKKNQTLGVIAKGSSSGQQILNTTQTAIRDTTLTQLAMNNTTMDRQNMIALNVNYRAKLDSAGRELTADFDHYHFSSTQNQSIRTQYLASDRPLAQALETRAGTTISLQTFKVNYAHPIPKVGLFEVGVKGSWVNSTNSLRYDTLSRAGWNKDESRSNAFYYHENVWAGYFSFSKDIGRSSLQLGLRGENTVTQGRSDNSTVNRQYFRWLPNIDYTFRPTDNSSFSISYARKLTRPNFQDLNPFQFYVDPFSYTEGNPFLLPVTGNQLDLSYTYKSWTFNTFYRHDTDVINQIPEQNDQTRVIRYIMRNTDSYMSTGADVSVLVKVTPWWKSQNFLLVKYDAFKTYYIGTDYVARQLSYFVKTAQAFTLPSKIDLEVLFNYRSPSIETVYRIRPIYTFSVGFHKTFMDGKLDVNASLSDVFYMYRMVQQAQVENLNATIVQRNGSRELAVRLTYKLGRSTFRRQAHMMGSQEEQSRVKQ